MNNKNEISERVKKALRVIEEKEHTKIELQNYFNNINASDDINENERELLINTVELIIKTKHPSIAKKMFGSKEAKAREFLESLFLELSKEFDWSKNLVESRVKTGGDMINGNNYVCLYISYKNNLGINTGLHYRQITPKDDPFLEVQMRQIKKGEIEKKMIKEKNFSVECEEDAVEFYKELLSETIKE